MFTSLTSAHGDGRGRHPPEVASVLNEKLAELSDLVRDASSTFSGRPSSTLDLAKRGTGLAPATGWSHASGSSSVSTVCRVSPYRKETFI
jgi:hypothetical protein